MNGRTKALGAAIVAAGLFGLAPQAQATLIGDTVNFDLPGLSTVSPGSAVVGAGVEAQITEPFSGGLVDVDVDDASITLSHVGAISFQFVFAEVLTISDLDWVDSPGRIVNFGFVNGVGFLNATDITIGDDFVSIDLGGTIWSSSSSAVINLEVAHDPPPPTNAVPEPITAGLGLLALAGLGYTTKRRRVG